MIRRIKPRSDDGKLRFIQELVTKKSDQAAAKQEPAIQKPADQSAAPQPIAVAQPDPSQSARPEQVNGADKGMPLEQPSVQDSAKSNMWDLAEKQEPQVAAEQAPAPSSLTPSAASLPSSDMPEADGSRSMRRGGRTKTRLLGFERSSGQLEDISGNPVTPEPTRAPAAKADRYPVGWIIVLKGPGRGHSMSLQAGVSQMGRGEDQAVQLDFGDMSISRENHASIAYDDEQRKFFIGHGGKSNLVRLNEKPVLSTEDLYHGDLIRIGETTLLFLALCGENFSWSEEEAPETTDE
ncbi:FHA domain-containing protein [Pseudaestuariivita rosea]|uniref:FHA domain-containing protein n=1 Tax=Pseudaestuariivita rosea TaxID=2763263 RepID=UPI001F00F80E|nr:FHA domain-containing protein [Pseudaestuariivita rosea]